MNETKMLEIKEELMSLYDYDSWNDMLKQHPEKYHTLTVNGCTITMFTEKDGGGNKTSRIFMTNQDKGCSYEYRYRVCTPEYKTVLSFWARKTLMADGETKIKNFNNGDVGSSRNGYMEFIEAVMSGIIDISGGLEIDND